MFFFLFYIILLEYYYVVVECGWCGEVEYIGGVFFGDDFFGYFGVWVYVVFIFVFEYCCLDV